MNGTSTFNYQIEYYTTFKKICGVGVGKKKRATHSVVECVARFFFMRACTLFFFPTPYTTFIIHGKKQTV
jgi:hypothetical protein